MKKALVEFVGTFFLTFTVATAAVLGTGGPLAAFAIGTVLAVMIYAGGHISGGHFNPSVTLAVFLRGRCSLADLVPYFIAQLAAAVVAALLAKHVIAPALAPEAAKIAVFVGWPLRFDPIEQCFIHDEAANRLIDQPMRAPWRV